MYIQTAEKRKRDEEESAEIRERKKKDMREVNVSTDKEIYTRASKYRYIEREKMMRYF